MQIRYRFIAILLPLLWLSCCDKDDEIVKDSHGVVVQLPHLWATDISDNYRIPDLSILTPIIYDKSNILVGSGENRQRSILSLDVNDGHINWESSDLQG